MAFKKIRQKLKSKGSSEGTPWQRATAELEKQNKAEKKQKTSKKSGMQAFVERKKSEIKKK